MIQILTHRVTAYAQIILSALFISGYFMVLWEFTHGKITVAENLEQTFTALLSVLTAAVLQIVSYWFQRQRTSEEPAK